MKEMINEEILLKILSNVEDPDLKRDLVTLQMIEDIDINLKDKKIIFKIILTTPACPLQEIIKKNCLDAIYENIDKDWKIEIKFGAKVTTQDKISLDFCNIKNIIAIGSGKGGVGKSTICVNIAASLAKQGAKVGILDADIFGPSICLMLNKEYCKPTKIKIGEKNFMEPIVSYDMKLMSIGFLTDNIDGSLIWRGPIASKALKQLLYETNWSDLDYLFVDLPPGTSDIHITVAQSFFLTGVVFVTLPQKVCCLDTSKSIDMFKKNFSHIPIIGLIENMYDFGEINKNNISYVSELLERHNIKKLGQIIIDREISKYCDLGIPIGTLSDAKSFETFRFLSQKVAQEISLINNSAKS